MEEGAEAEAVMGAASSFSLATFRWPASSARMEAMAGTGGMALPGQAWEVPGASVWAAMGPMDNLERRVLLISITKLSRFDIQDWGPNRLQVQVFAHELSQRPEHEIWGVLDNEKLVAVAVCPLGPPV